MSDKKNWGSTVMGWFVVKDQLPGGTDESSAAPSSAEEDVIRRAAAQPQLNVFTTPPPAATGGTVNFDEVFEAAGIDAA